MAVIGCYTVDLYCDTGGDRYGGKCPHKSKLGGYQGQYMGRNQRECLRQAREDGWVFRKNTTLTYCPKCRPAG